MRIACSLHVIAACGLSDRLADLAASKASASKATWTAASAGVEIGLGDGEQYFKSVQSLLEHYPGARQSTIACVPASTTSICVACTFGGIELQFSEKDQHL